MTDAQKGMLLMAAVFAAIAGYLARFILLQWREGESGIPGKTQYNAIFFRRSQNPVGYWFALSFWCLLAAVFAFLAIDGAVEAFVKGG